MSATVATAAATPPVPKSSFVRRLLDVEFTLAAGVFNPGGRDTVRVSGLRVAATISDAGSPSRASANIRVYGLTTSQQNQLSTLGLTLTTIKQNEIALYAGDDRARMSLVFKGTIFRALVDFDSAPSVMLNIMANAGLYNAILPAAPTSYRGPVDAATILSGMAARANLGFVNYGVSKILTNPYYSGTGGEQIAACAKEADINVDPNDNDVLVIWPKYGSRGDLVPVISPGTGLVGYPRYHEAGIELTMLYMPGVGRGGAFQLKTSLPRAQREWIVHSISHNLESNVPNGQWTSSLLARTRDGAPINV